MFSKKIFHFISYQQCFILIFFILFFIFFIPTTVHAGLFDGTPALVGKLNSAFEKIEDWLLKLATPAAAVAVITGAAAVAVAVGVFMKKFSFGDEERIRTAKKIIRGSLFSYGFILVLNLILSAIKSLLT